MTASQDPPLRMLATGETDTEESPIPEPEPLVRAGGACLSLTHKEADELLRPGRAEEVEQ